MLKIYLIFSMLSFTLLLCFLSMLYFSRMLYYVQILLVSLITILCLMVYYNTVSNLLAILLSLVYIGAILIFIRYICAISPNPIFNSNVFFRLFFVVLLLGFTLGLLNLPFRLNSCVVTLFDFFYTGAGINLFFFIVFFLLIILIIISSQNFIPKGPFRSV